MREIELKFRVDKLEDITSILEKNNCAISKVINQADTIYVSDLGNVESTSGSVWLRVRKEDEKVELNYKKQSPKKMESEEIEFTVGDYKKANDFLKALGYKEWVQVNKKRRYSKYKEYNICIDEVERLGTFVEIELLINEDNNKDYEEELYKVAKELGIDKDNRINSHYDTMIYELNKE